MRLLRFIHKVFKPNCDCMICESPRCELCEELKLLLQTERIERDKLIQAFVRMNQPVVQNIQREEETEPVVIKGPRRWADIRRGLEEADRLKANELRSKQNIEDNQKREVIIKEMDKLKPMTEAEINEFLEDDQAKDSNKEVSQTQNSVA